MTTRTQDEAAYDRAVASCVPKLDGHVAPEHADDRLYMITTLAASPRFGGTRTVAACRTFERAQKIVETNEGDIWEYSYRLVVIEVALADCLYGATGHIEGPTQFWYRWEGGPGGEYRPIEIPKQYENVLAWAF